jgi:putative heme-binding domain-containing protein
MAFWLAGHNGFPGTQPPPKNFVRLRDAQSGEVLAEAVPPRNDLAQPIKWDLHAYSGRRGCLELVDGDDGAAFAWLAIGRLEPAVVALPSSSLSEESRQQRMACVIVGELQLTELLEPAQRLLASKSIGIDTRAAAAVAVTKLGSSDGLNALKAILQNQAASAALRSSVAADLARIRSPQSRSILVDAFSSAPAALQSRYADALLVDSAGAEALLEAVAKGRAPARLLLEQKVLDRLSALDLPGWKARADKLTMGVAAPREETQKLIAARRAHFSAQGAQVSAARGARVFTQSCAMCHQIAGQGNVVGPQLDGIGARGADRVLEDVLDPNRNVDPSFRYSILLLKNNDVVIALPRREENESLVVVDTTGKSMTIPKSTIRQQRQSQASLMPDNFGASLSEADFDDLLAYLLAQRK